MPATPLGRARSCGQIVQAFGSYSTLRDLLLKPTDVMSKPYSTQLSKRRAADSSYSIKSERKYGSPICLLLATRHLTGLRERVECVSSKTTSPAPLLEATPRRQRGGVLYAPYVVTWSVLVPLPPRQLLPTLLRALTALDSARVRLPIAVTP